MLVKLDVFELLVVFYYVKVMLEWKYGGGLRIGVRWGILRWGCWWGVELWRCWGKLREMYLFIMLCC